MPPKGWRTRAQILKLHGGDEDVVSKIIERKIQMGQTKDHPDAPDDPHATLYYVLLDLGQMEEDIYEDKLEQTGMIEGNDAEAGYNGHELYSKS